MSYQYWTVDGYGICTDEIEKDVTLKNLQNLISLAPEYDKRVEEIFKENNIHDPEVEDYFNLVPCDYGCGIAEIMANVINEAENVVRFECCSRFDEKKYLIFVPTYPWSYRAEGEKYIKSPEDVERIIEKYCKILSNKPVSFEYGVVSTVTFKIRPSILRETRLMADSGAPPTVETK